MFTSGDKLAVLLVGPILPATYLGLEGSFAVSIIDCDTNELYIARVGSVLHYNNKGCYSTIPGTGYTELKEGVIRRLNKKTLRFNKVGEFKHTSPFLFI